MFLFHTLSEKPYYVMLFNLEVKTIIFTGSWEMKFHLLALEIELYFELLKGVFP